MRIRGMVFSRVDARKARPLPDLIKIDNIYITLLQN